MTFKFIVVGLLLAVVTALFSGLYALMKGGREGQTEAERTRMVRSLTWRIGLSIGLFILLLAALRFGWVQSQ
jgi:cytochrome b561